MSKMVTMALAAILMITCGCLDTIGEYALSDLGGWDMSACWNGFDTCYELFSDNQDVILGGQQAIDVRLFGVGQ